MDCDIPVIEREIVKRSLYTGWRAAIGMRVKRPQPRVDRELKRSGVCEIDHGVADAIKGVVQILCSHATLMATNYGTTDRT
jgi:hypothetical protein